MNSLVVIIASVAGSASTAGVAITALVLNSKGFDLIDKRLDSIERKLELISSNLERIEQLSARTCLD
jgi:tetrahydromethanopterin S-methyltransferase subunit G